MPVIFATGSNTAILLAKIAALLRRAYASGQAEPYCWNGAILHLESSLIEYKGQNSFIVSTGQIQAPPEKGAWVACASCGASFLRNNGKKILSNSFSAFRKNSDGSDFFTCKGLLE